MSYEQSTPVGTKIRGLILLCAMFVVIAIVILICFTILGATFKGFDTVSYLLSNPKVGAGALTDFNFLKSTTVGIFQVLVVAIPLSALGTIVGAIYVLKSRGDEF